MIRDIFLGWKRGYYAFFPAFLLGDNLIMIKKNIIIKQDTTENWNKAKNFIPKENELILYIDSE
jgi:hypothetical protein